MIRLVPSRVEDGWAPGLDRALTDEINNTVGNPQSACRFHTAAKLNNLGPQLPVGTPLVPIRLGAIVIRLESSKVLLGQVDEAGANILPYQVLSLGVDALDGDLHLELAAPKAQVQDGLAPSRLAVLGGNIAGHAPLPGTAPSACLVLLYLVIARDAEIDLALAHEGRDVGGGEEDEGDWEVLDEGDVEAVLAAELYVGALQEIERGLLEAALWWSMDQRSALGPDVADFGRRGLLLGTAKSSRPSRLRADFSWFSTFSVFGPIETRERSYHMYEVAARRLPQIGRLTRGNSLVHQIHNWLLWIKKVVGESERLCAQPIRRQLGTVVSPGRIEESGLGPCGNGFLSSITGWGGHLQ